MILRDRCSTLYDLASNCCVFDVVKLKQLGILVELQRFRCCQV